MAWWVRHKALSEKESTWDEWFYATFQVYNRTAAWIDLRRHPWWKQVLETTQRAENPERVMKSVALLDALVQRDGAALADAVDYCSVQDRCNLDPRLVALAGAFALEMNGAGETARKRWVDAKMKHFGNTDDSSDMAYRIIRAHLE